MNKSFAIKQPMAIQKRRKQQASPVRFVSYLVMIAASCCIVFPLLMVLFTSFKTDQEYVSTTVFQLPQSFLNFENYKNAFMSGRFLRAFKNSAILVIAGALGNVALGSMTAYCLGRFQFPGRSALNLLYVISAAVPGATLQISIYLLLKNMQLTGTMAAPILLYVSTDIVQIWIYLQYIETISVSLDESAMLDGASYFRIFCSIIFPLLMPATATVLILKTVAIYNDMFVQYLYMMGDKLQTVSTALQTFAGVSTNLQNTLSAAIIIVMLPTVIIFLALQKKIFGGIVMGSVKG